MLNPADNWFLSQEEPIKSCLQFLRQYILDMDKGITEKWAYSMPFFCYKGKRVCYLWIHKKYRQPYIGIVDGHLISYPGLIAEKRARMKIFLIDPERNIPVRKIHLLLKQVLKNYK